jgi:hypothetical protein
MNNLLETIVCSAQIGREARLERMIAARVEFKLREDGCVKSWYAKSADDENLFIIQSLFVDRESWKEISERVMDILDSKDGGIETCLLGPPLIGIFSIDQKKIVG